jgi:hypothetical protein
MPGDNVTTSGIDGLTGGIFIGRIDPHPLYPQLSLVIWRLHNGEISLDALSPRMEVSGNINTHQRAHFIYRAIHPKKPTR